MITQQPAGASILAGGSATFTVGASGAGTLYYHWRINGTNLSGATNASYTVTNAQNANQGNYSVLVSNSLNAVVSSNALLTVDSLPIINAQPQGESLTVGNNAAFTVSASGPPTLSYQWQLNSVNLTNNSRISGSQSGSLAITSVLTGDVGNYRVIISNSFGATNSAAAALAVAKAATTVTWSNPAAIIYGAALGASQLNAAASQPGSFIYTPASGSVPNAGSTTLSVVFTPNDPADYFGATNSVSLNVTPASLTVTASNATRSYGQANPALSAGIVGAVNGDTFTASANCPATLTNLPGNYPIVPHITDPNNRLTNYNLASVNGTLTITAAPAPTIADIEPDNGSTNGGTYVTISGTGFESGATVSFGALPAVSVTVSNATNLIVVTPAVSATGPVNVILTNADGQSVVFTNGFTYTGAQISLNAPQISAGPTNQTVGLGSNAAFTVAASGSGTLAYQWLFNSTNVSGATNYTFALTNVQPANAGSYFVIVSNLDGAATSSVATLSIPGQPVSFTAAPGSLQFANGQFQFQISGLTGQGPVIIESSTDFVNWLPIYTNQSGYGQFQFTDTNAANGTLNFYRAVTPPAP